MSLGSKWLALEELDFMSSLLRWLQSHKHWPEGLSVDIKLSLDYDEHNSFEVVTEDFCYWFIKPIEEPKE